MCRSIVDHRWRVYGNLLIRYGDRDQSATTEIGDLKVICNLKSVFLFYRRIDSDSEESATILMPRYALVRHLVLSFLLRIRSST